MRFAITFSALAVALVLVSLYFAGGGRPKPESPASTPADVAPSPPAADVASPSVADTVPAPETAAVDAPAGPEPLPPVEAPPAVDGPPTPQPGPPDAAAPPRPPDRLPPTIGDETREPPGAGPITHPVEGMENCVDCHKVGRGRGDLPGDHADYANETCQACHSRSAS